MVEICCFLLLVTFKSLHCQIIPLKNVYLSKPIEYIIPRMMQTVDFGDYEVSLPGSLDCQQLYHTVLRDVDNGEKLCTCGGREYMRSLCTFSSVLL